MTRSRLIAAALAAAAAATAAPASLPASATSSSAATVVRGLYAWYAGPHPGKDRFWGDDLPRAKAYLDPGLYTLLRNTIAYQNARHEAILDFDPFIGAQIRATSTAVGTPTARGAYTAVPVAVTYEHAGKGVVTAIVSNATGRVYDIEGSNYKLRSLLTTSLK